MSAVDEMCSVCLEAGCDMSFPGCGHRFHALCALKVAQHSLRCPMCRHCPIEAPVRDPPVTEPNTYVITHHIDLSDFQRQWRNYTTRRRRFINQRPQLREREANLRTLRAEMNDLLHRIQTVYVNMCKDIWRTDPQVVDLRRQLANLRRREARLRHRIDDVVDNAVHLYV